MELLPLVLIVAVFWLFIIRPQRNRARELSRVQGALVPGQRVMTGAGLYATVAAVEDDHVVLEVAPGVLSRYARQAVVRVLDDPTAPDDAPGDGTTSDVGGELEQQRPDDEPPGGRL
ncbi:MAG TPA: preprotein translocase subunit YajC [Jiangellales bacterium]|jgi:preprotein translocase subunit YajC|nr:preprotein translocase subunit YajC [Jiangellales bacterium]